MRRAIPREVTAKLWGAAAGRCQFSGCAQSLTIDPISKRRANFAERAHVYPIGKQGPRATKSASTRRVNDIGNLMLLCRPHHRLVDQLPSDFPSHMLIAMKNQHENRVRLATNFRTMTPSNVLYVRVPIGEKRLSMLDSEAIWTALASDRHHPATDSPLVIDLAAIETNDSEGDFWSSCEKTVRRKVESAFSPHGSFEHADHISLFALAPMPILMTLGKILGDTRAVSVYQYDRFESRWRWKVDGDPEPAKFSYRIHKRRVVNQATIALAISLSAEIDMNLVAKAMPRSDYHTVRFGTTKPGYSVIRGEPDLVSFHRGMRDCLNDIEARFGTDCEIHVFPALPASAATQFGRLLLPKASPAMRIYDHNAKNGGFHPALWLVDRRTGALQPRCGRVLADTNRSRSRTTLVSLGSTRRCVASSE